MLFELETGEGVLSFQSILLIMKHFECLFIIFAMYNQPDETQYANNHEQSLKAEYRIAHVHVRNWHILYQDQKNREQ